MCSVLPLALQTLYSRLLVCSFHCVSIHSNASREYCVGVAEVTVAFSRLSHFSVVFGALRFECLRFPCFRHFLFRLIVTQCRPDLAMKSRNKQTAIVCV